LGQLENVFAPFAQRGNDDRDDVEPVIEVFAKMPVAHGPLKVAISRCQYPDIERDRDIGAESLHAVILEHTQHLDLGRWAEIADLIQKDRAPFRKLELANAPLRCSRECAALMAEQFRLQKRLRDRRTVDLDHAL
jgi:hypothetical protein